MTSKGVKMISTEEIEEILQKAVPDATVGVVDLTGTSDHFEIRISSPSFKGTSLVDQHQVVNRALKEPLDDGRIHAIKIKTFVPAKAS